MSNLKTNKVRVGGIDYEIEDTEAREILKILTGDTEESIEGKINLVKEELLDKIDNTSVTNQIIDITDRLETVNELVESFEGRLNNTIEAGNIILDNEVNSESSNPVMNKAISQALDEAIQMGKELAKRDLYIAAGAQYNDTDKNIVKTTPWAAYVDSAEYKAQWDLDVLTGTVQTFVSSENVTYEYIDDGGEWKIITRVGDKLIWDDTKVVHRIGCYYLSGLGHLTDSDMITIYNNKDGLYKPYHRGNQNYAGKAYYPVHNRLMYTAQDIFNYKASCFQNNILPVILFFKDSYTNSFSGSAPIESSSVFYNSTKLRVIMAIKAKNAIYSNTFYNCKKLSTLIIAELSKNVNLLELPIISKGSILFMIEKANPTSAITITLHSDAYNRLVNDADVVSALATKNTELATGGGSINLVSA